MNRYRNILLVEADRPISADEASRAVTLARRNAARLTVLSVLNPRSGLVSILTSADTAQAVQEGALRERATRLHELLPDSDVVHGIEAVMGPTAKMVIDRVRRGGHDLVLAVARSEDQLERLSDELHSERSECLVLPADLTDPGSVASLVRTVRDKVGSLDVLVNNAAYCPTGPIISYSVEEWEKTFGINVTGMFVASREVVRHWLENNRKGNIVNIASQAAFRGSTTGHLPYDSSKGAMVSFTIALAREVARQGIRVNGLAPGLVRTEMVAETWEKRKDKYLSRIPLYRIAEPEEVASVAVFLASDAASYMTGATLDVSGGMIMR